MLVKVAAVQLNTGADVAANVDVADRLTRAAAADGAELIVLPGEWTATGSGEQVRAAAEARVLTVPAAFTLATTRDHWETLLRARAIENQAFVIAANQIGEHPAGMRSGGRSMIVDAWGLVLAQAPDEPTHIVAELDLERQREIRSALLSLANRRDDAYLWPQAARA